MVSRPETTKQQQQQHHDWHVIERKASSFCCLLIRVALFFPCCPTLVGSLVESAIRLTWELMAQLILAGSKVMGKGKWASPLVCRFRCGGSCWWRDPTSHINRQVPAHSNDAPLDSSREDPAAYGVVNTHHAPWSNRCLMMTEVKRPESDETFISALPLPYSKVEHE